MDEKCCEQWGVRCEPIEGPLCGTMMEKEPDEAGETWKKLGSGGKSSKSGRSKSKREDAWNRGGMAYGGFATSLAFLNLIYIKKN